MSEVMNVPDGWEVKSIGEISKTFAGGTPNREDSSYYGNDIPWVKSGEVNQSVISKTEEYITYEGLKNSSAKIIPKGTILVAMYGATAGQIAILDIEATSNQAVLAVPLKNDEVNYVLYMISFHMPKLLFQAQGSGQPNLSKQLVDRMLIHIPKKIEQQKIAKILSTLDKTIEATQKLIDKEKNIKKGLMHDLLTNGIDSNGKIRTPQTHTYKQSELGLIPEEWDVVQLGTIGKFKNGVNKSKEDFGFGIPFVNLQDVFGNWEIIQSDFDLVNANNEELKNYSLEKGDILFIRSSVKPSGVGLTSLVSEDIPTTIYSGFIIRFRSKDKIFDLNYKKYCFHEAMFRQRLLQKSTVSANSNVNQESLSSLNILLPPIKEQQKISKMLMTQDKKIDKEEAIFVKLEELKKSLMNDLLSGKVRVKL